MPHRLLAMLRDPRLMLSEVTTALFSIGALTFTGGELVITGGHGYWVQGVFTVVGLIVIYGVKFILAFRKDNQTAAATHETHIVNERARLLENKDAMFTQQRSNYEGIIHTMTATHEKQMEQQRESLLAFYAEKEREQNARFNELRTEKHDVTNELQAALAREVIIRERARLSGCDMENLFGAGWEAKSLSGAFRRESNQ